MKRRFWLLATLLAAVSARAADTPHLMVCADPNNMPFSNEARQGFENKIAELVAHDMHAQVDYLWWAQRRGYVRNTLNENRCDLWPGVAHGIEMASTTRPYYRSTYVFVTRAAAALKGLTLDDVRLKNLSIGVQMVGNDAMNTPPAHAIASRGIIDHVHGYMLYGNYNRPNPPSVIMDAIAHGEVDVALVWGPLAGYFAMRSPVALRLEPVTPADQAPWQMSFDISMGVRKNNSALLERVNTILERDKSKIDAILLAYHVPRVDNIS